MASSCPPTMQRSFRHGTRMNDPTMNANITLPNGRQVRIRALRHGELNTVRELCARLSPRTRYLRFLSPMPVLPASLLHMLADVDDPRRLTLIAELDADCGNVVALGNLVAVDDGHAELGLVVADAWQRQGIGVALAARLLHAADARGFQRFVVHGLCDNPGVRPVLRHTADVISARTRFGVTETMFVRRGFNEVSATALRGDLRCEREPASELAAGPDTGSADDRHPWSHRDPADTSASLAGSRAR